MVVGIFCVDVLKLIGVGNFLAVQQLGFCASTAGGSGLIPAWGTKIQHALGQQSLYTAMTEPVCSKASVPQEKPVSYN